MQTTYKKFLHSIDVDNWTNTYKKYFPSDSDNDKDFLEALYYYTGNTNVLVNNALRYNMELLKGDCMESLFQRMIAKLPTYQIPDDIIVYRYISKGLLKEMSSSYPPKKGMFLIDKGFMSTTLIKKSIFDHKQSDTSLKILLEISVPKGTRGIYVGHLNVPLLALTQPTTPKHHTPDSKQNHTPASYSSPISHKTPPQNSLSGTIHDSPR